MITVDDKQYDTDQFHTVEEAYRFVYGTPRHEHLASLNGEFILRTKWETTAVSDGDVLVFVPVVSGG